MKTSEINQIVPFSRLAVSLKRNIVIGSKKMSITEIKQNCQLCVCDYIKQIYGFTLILIFIRIHRMEKQVHPSVYKCVRALCVCVLGVVKHPDYLHDSTEL